MSILIFSFYFLTQNKRVQSKYNKISYFSTQKLRKKMNFWDKIEKKTYKKNQLMLI